MNMPRAFQRCRQGYTVEEWSIVHLPVVESFFSFTHKLYGVNLSVCWDVCLHRAGVVDSQTQYITIYLVHCSRVPLGIKMLCTSFRYECRSVKWREN